MRTESKICKPFTREGAVILLVLKKPPSDFSKPAYRSSHLRRLRCLYIEVSGNISDSRKYKNSNE